MYPPKGATEPRPNCSLCPRLVQFRTENQAAHPSFYNGAVQSFGSMDARHLILGLAPGLKGANRTGRPFTGDFSGELLYKCLDKIGLSNQQNQNRPDDEYKLTDTLITNAVRCVPPQNKPTTEEVKKCRPYLTNLIGSMPNLTVIFALGKVAHDALLRTYGLTLAHYKFAHNIVHTLPNGLVLVDSYHCSRYNVNTGVLTETMFMQALQTMRKTRTL